jgi:hypothetical protein
MEKIFLGTPRKYEFFSCVENVRADTPIHFWGSLVASPSNTGRK